MFSKFLKNTHESRDVNYISVNFDDEIRFRESYTYKKNMYFYHVLFTIKVHCFSFVYGTPKCLTIYTNAI